MTDSININIWYDYFDDGYVPEGEIQETYAYVESKLDENDAQNVLHFLKEKIESMTSNNTLKLELVFYDSAIKYPHLIGTEYEFILYKRWQLNMSNLTHELRESIVQTLEQENLHYNNIPLTIYSES